MASFSPYVSVPGVGLRLADSSPRLLSAQDIAAEFVVACEQHGIRPGFYHGSVNNAFLNLQGGKIGAPTGIPGQAVITQTDYENILLANLRQLWTDYGELAEVWFDGGIPAGFSSKLWALHQELQPNAVAFQGPTVGRQPNLIRWAGTEGGHVQYPFWSQTTAKAPASPSDGSGSPTGPWFAPGEADTCFQTGKKPAFTPPRARVVKCSHGDPQQVWTHNVPQAGFIYNNATNLCLNVAGCATKVMGDICTKAPQQTCGGQGFRGQLNEVFALNGARITSALPGGKCLTVKIDNGETAVDLTACDPANPPTQSWSLTPSGQLKTADGRCMTTAGGGTVSDGAPYGGCWFYNKGMQPKSLTELVSSYHDSVGKNAFWLLDWSPQPAGTLRADHIARYAELGDWLRECYSTPIAESTVLVGKTMSFTVPAGHAVDRVVLKEDLSKGQRVRSFTVTAKVSVAYSQTVANGTSIGNKFIALLNQPYPAGTTLTLNIDRAVGAAAMTSFAGYNCSQTPTPTGCSYEKDFAWKIVKSITITAAPKSTPAACCALCRTHTTCAVFVLGVDKTCTLLSANQGGVKSEGVISGTKS
jgi:hypothetical protein